MNRLTRLAGLATEVDDCVGAGAKLLRLVEEDTECEVERVWLVNADAEEEVTAASPPLAKWSATTRNLNSPSEFH